MYLKQSCEIFQVLNCQILKVKGDIVLNHWLFNGYLSTDAIIQQQTEFIAVWKQLITAYQTQADIDDFQILRKEMLVFGLRVSKEVLQAVQPAETPDIPAHLTAAPLKINDERLFERAKAISGRVLKLIPPEDNRAESFIRQNFTLLWMALSELEDMEAS